MGQNGSFFGRLKLAIVGLVTLRSERPLSDTIPTPIVRTSMAGCDPKETFDADPNCHRAVMGSSFTHQQEGLPTASTTAESPTKTKAGAEMISARSLPQNLRTAARPR